MHPHLGANLVIVAALGGTAEVATAADADVPKVSSAPQPVRLELLGASTWDEPAPGCNGGTITGRLVLTQGYLQAAPPLVDLAQATLMVTTLDDVVDPHDGVLSLREAINKANASATPDRITFAPKLAGGVIALTSSLPAITQPLIIDGDLNNDLRPDIKIDGSHASYVTPLTVTNAKATLDGLTITGASTGFYHAQEGSGIQAYNAKLTVISSVISGNDSYFAGGGISISGGSLQIIGSSINGNGAGHRYEGFGGGISTYNTAVTITDSTIDRNGANGNELGEGYSSFGGGIDADGGSLLIVDSTISNNSTSGASSYRDGAGGGGIHAGNVTIVNSTVANNEAYGSYSFRYGTIAHGGGILARKMTIINSTVSGNSAVSAAKHGNGGGVSVASMTVRNSIIANNRADLNADIAGMITHSNGHNLFRQARVRGAAPGDLRAVDPRLGPLQKNGGPTKTMALLPGSPALNHGLNADAPGRTDQRGFPRISHGHVDIGAFERQQPAASLATFDRLSSDTASPLACDSWLRWPVKVMWRGVELAG